MENKCISALNYIRSELCSVLKSLSAFAFEYKELPCLGYTHYQPAQLVTVGKRASLWMQDLLSDLDEIDFDLSQLKFLGCRGTTGTEASFMELFEGDEEKIESFETLLWYLSNRLNEISEECYKLSGEIDKMREGLDIEADVMADVMAEEEKKKPSN